ncbi:MAG: DNA polymerase III subunit [bacterium]
MSWKDILGQQQAINILKKVIEQNRLASAYLFLGPDGVGKIKTAKQLAKICNCQDIKEGDSCEICNSCYKINHDIHPDVKVIKPAAMHFLLPQIQDLQKDVFVSPFEGRKKVYLLDEVDKMTPEAANAFLKTLEEPSPTTLFILITSRPQTILPTILSRCQPVRFNLIPEDIQSQIFLRWQVEPSKISLLTQLSGGSIGKAKEYLEKDVFVSLEKLAPLLESILKKEEGFLLICKLVTLILADYKKEDISLFFELLSVWLKQKLSVNFISLYRAMDIVMETHKMIKFKNANLQLSLEVMFIHLKTL